MENRDKDISETSLQEREDKVDSDPESSPPSPSSQDHQEGATVRKLESKAAKGSGLGKAVPVLALAALVALLVRSKKGAKGAKSLRTQRRLSFRSGDVLEQVKISPSAAAPAATYERDELSLAAPAPTESEMEVLKEPVTIAPAKAAHKPKEPHGPVPVSAMPKPEKPLTSNTSEPVPVSAVPKPEKRLTSNTSVPVPVSAVPKPEPRLTLNTSDSAASWPEDRTGDADPTTPRTGLDVPPFPEATQRDMVERLQNQALAHEVILDPEYQMQPPAKDPMRAQVETSMKRAYWDMFSQSLAKHDFKMLFDNLQEIKGRIAEAIPSKRQDMREALDGNFDLEHLAKQIEHRAFDAESLRQIISTVLDIILQLEAPARAQRSEAGNLSIIVGPFAHAFGTLGVWWVNKLSERRLGDGVAWASLWVEAKAEELDEKCQDKTWEGHLPEIFEYINDKLNMLSLDVMNFQLRMMAGFLKVHGARYERDKFTDMLQKGETSLKVTTEWLEQQRTAITTSEFFTASEKLVCLRSRSGPASPPSTSQVAETDTRSFLLHRYGIMSLLQHPTALDASTCPEILHLDLKNLVQFQNSLQAWTLVGALMMFASQMLGTKGVVLSPDKTRQLKSGLFQMLNHPLGNIRSLQEFLLKFFVMVLEEEGIAAMSDTETAMVRRMAEKTASTQDTFYQTMNKTLLKTMWAYLRHPTQEEAEAALNSCQLIVKDEITSSCKLLGRIVSHNFDVHRATVYRILNS
ncbi:hypothetical protein CYMTET_44919 [Cymbomonas tetramitiformis]|uniref:Uncharacterized protein n=1 Tax=Cymbomonas tetramitiformis TaxID=36881 RepID=A0AAE0C1B9_9CHLO|nr:hypothetical protein CYMTET_44919 [Cymbomonas tetramitiformis]